MARRFRIYLFGFGLGLLMVYFMFGSRSCNWGGYLPGGRVLTELQKGSIDYTDSLTCEIECRGLLTRDIDSLLTQGVVNFDESLPQGTPKVYAVEGLTATGKAVKVIFERADSTTTIQAIKLPAGGNCDC